MIEKSLIRYNLKNGNVIGTIEDIGYFTGKDKVNEYVYYSFDSLDSMWRDIRYNVGKNRIFESLEFQS